MQIGLKPDEVLDMSLEMFQSCAKGYLDRMFDLQLLGIQQGYWAGYFTRSKKPKSIKSIVEKMVKAKTKRDADPKSIKTAKPEVDVETFQEMEARFQKRLHEIE